jgi:hypothetical protein
VSHTVSIVSEAVPKGSVVGYAELVLRDGQDVAFDDDSVRYDFFYGNLSIRGNPGWGSDHGYEASVSRTLLRRGDDDSLRQVDIRVEARFLQFEPLTVDHAIPYK